MTKKEMLRNLLEQAKKENLFVGTGNPESNILIVGKEASIKPDNKGQINLEITDNIPDWERDIDKHFSEIPDFFETNFFSPLYPYKGQINIRNNNQNKGTSNTWLKYKKLWDKIFIKDGGKSEKINFHEKCFITELNQITSPNSSQLRKKYPQEVIEKMIQKRKEIILQSAYIQSFPVVVLACGPYISEYKIDIPLLFDVKPLKPEGGVPYGKKGKKQWYNAYKAIHGNLPKLVIHSWHFMLVKDELIEMMGKNIADFCTEHNISF